MHGIGTGCHGQFLLVSLAILFYPTGDGSELARLLGNVRFIFSSSFPPFSFQPFCRVGPWWAIEVVNIVHMYLLSTPILLRGLLFLHSTHLNF